MIIFGLILFILAVIVIAYVWLATSGMTPISIDYGILNVEITPLWFFFAGGIVLAVATSGLWLMGVGAKTSARRAKEMRELRRQAKEYDRRVERDRDRDALGADQDRSRTTGRTGAAPATDRGTTTSRPTAGTTDAPRDGSARGAASSPTGENQPGGGQQPILPRPGRDDGR